MKNITFLIITICMIMLICAGCGRGSSEKESTTEAFSEAAAVSGFEITTEKMTTEQESSEATTEITEEATTEAMVNPREKILISIDPGHQSEKIDMSAKEPNAPGSSEMKTKASTGTTGKYTGIPEYKLNLDISLMLRDELENLGYKVIMTREDNDTAISNIERAELANDAGADFSIRIHANGDDNTDMNGALALVGSQDNQYVGHLYEKSYHLADSVLNAYCEKTGMKNLGVMTSDTMTGINWSEIPVMILEMGFMSNESDDRNMADDSYRKIMVEGIVDGIENYYSFDKFESDENDSTGANLLNEDDALKEKIDALLQKERDKGAVASAYVKNLKTGDYVDLSTEPHRSASIIKLYVAGCVYSNIAMLSAAGNSEDEINTLVCKMISASDNDATNTMIKMLGSGDKCAGFDKVTNYARSFGYTETKMGRLMLEFDSENDNYTTVTETGSFLEKIYKGEVSGSDKILSYMKAQERTSKIPAGIPKGVIVANKTGELDDVEHDVAIVYGDDADYIICVMLSQLSDTASGRETIKEISALVYDYWK